MIIYVEKKVLLTNYDKKLENFSKIFKTVRYKIKVQKSMALAHTHLNQMESKIVKTMNNTIKGSW